MTQMALLSLISPIHSCFNEYASLEVLTYLVFVPVSHTVSVTFGWPVTDGLQRSGLRGPLNALFKPALGG